MVQGSAMTIPVLRPKSLPPRARRVYPGRKVRRFEGGVAKSWTESPPMPMPSAFTPSNPVGRSWTGVDAFGSAQLERDAGILADLRPDRREVADEPGVLDRRHRLVLGQQHHVLEALLHVGRLVRLLQLVIELGHHLWRQAFRAGDADPGRG